MRMWMLYPRIMCRQHLLGEHLEIHMFAGTLRRGISVEGYLEKGLLEGASLRSRHNALVKEMLRRGYNHKSPLDDYPEETRGKVDRLQSFTDLMDRCPECRERAAAIVQEVPGITFWESTLTGENNDI